MGTRRGFTLIELLAVIGIMLVLMVAAFGVFNLFAQQTGPQAAAATVQAMLNAARDYAASNGVDAQVVFTADPTRPLDGTSMQLEYMPINGTAFVPVPGRQPIMLREEVYVLKEMPSLLGITVPDPVDFKAAPATVENQLGLWATYEKNLLNAVTDFAIGSDGKPKAEHREFYVVFDPVGYMKGDPAEPAKTVRWGMTVVQVSGNRVVQYVFYPLNANTGTRLVFE